MRKLLATVAVAVMACGGGETAQTETGTSMAAQPEAAPAQTAQVAAPATGTVHEVQMLLTANGAYVYQPAQLTIRPGDTVRWINVSGGPHNVAFYADKIPAGARSFLQGAMPSTMQGGRPLSGELMIAPNATWEMVFAGAPVGTYEYYCTPHEMLNMKGTLTVAE